ncbi:MAG: hypothetical protein RL642_42 [Bacteroidota bacterium]|jgi:hypothetical protein
MRLLLYIFLSLIAFEVKAQQAQGWFSAQLPFRKDKWEWHNDFGYRNELSKFSTQQFLYRTGVRHYFTDKISGAFGYAFFDTKVQGVESTEFGPENRLWQEFNGVVQLNKGNSFIHRIRTEERWFSRTSIGNSFFGFRSRYRVAFQRKLSESIDVQCYNELMYQLRETQFDFNQNRVGFNFFVKLSSKAQINVGYTYMSTSQNPFHLILIGFAKR